MEVVNWLFRLSQALSENLILSIVAISLIILGIVRRIEGTLIQINLSDSQSWCISSVGFSLLILVSMHIFYNPNYGQIEVTRAIKRAFSDNVQPGQGNNREKHSPVGLEYNEANPSFCFLSKVSQLSAKGGCRIYKFNSDPNWYIETDGGENDNLCEVTCISAQLVK